MPFNGSGVFVREENWSNDAANNLPISATKFDIEDNDFAGGFDLCLTRDGQGAPTAPLTWAQLLTLTRGSDGQLLGLARTGGSNNPGLQFNVADVGGFTIGTTIATAIAIAIAGTAALTISSTRTATIGAPSSGVALTVNAASGADGIHIVAASGQSPALALVGSGTYTSFFNMGAGGSGSGQFQVNGQIYQTVSQAGNTTFAAPTSGDTVTAGGFAGSAAFKATADLTTVFGLVFNSTSGTPRQYGFYTANSTNDLRLRDITGSADRIIITSTGQITFGPPSSGTAVTINGVGTAALATVNSNAGGVRSSFQNSNGGTTSYSELGPINDAGRILSMAISSSGFSGSLMTGGPAGVSAALYTDGAYPLVLAVNATAAMIFNTSRQATIPAPSSNTQAALTVTGAGSGATGLSITGAAAVGAAISGAGTGITITPSSAGLGINFVNGGAAANVMAFGTNYFSTGTAAPVLTANKPGAGTAIIGWLSVTLNSTQGWVAVWSN